MIISLIAAIARNGAIGKDGKLLWSLPDDLNRFRDLTRGNPVIMGRKTYESLPENRRPLPKRPNIVVTRQEREFVGCDTVHSVPEALEAAKKYESEEIFIIGGEQIYKEGMQYAHRMYLTFVDADFEGDAFFPEIPEEWEVKESEEHVADERHAYAFTYKMFERR